MGVPCGLFSLELLLNAPLVHRFRWAVCSRNQVLHAGIGVLSTALKVFDLLQQSHEVAMAFLAAWALGVDRLPAIFRAVCPCRKTSSFSSCNQDATGSVAKWFPELPEEFHVALPHLL